MLAADYKVFPSWPCVASPSLRAHESAPTNTYHVSWLLEKTLNALSASIVIMVVSHQCILSVGVSQSRIGRSFPHTTTSFQTVELCWAARPGEPAEAAAMQSAWLRDPHGTWCVL